MTTKTEGKHTGEFLLSEGPGTLSRDVATLTGGDGEDGLIVVFDGADLVAATGDSEEEVAGVLFGAAVEDAEAPYVSRLAEVKGVALKYPEDTAESEAAMIEALAARDIIVRSPFANFDPAPEPSESESESA